MTAAGGTSGARKSSDNGGKALVGAAARYTGRKVGKTQTTDKTGQQAWQQHAWDLYDAVPELRFAAQWVGNAMSAARLIAGKRADDGSVEELPHDHPASQLVATIAGGPAGQSTFLGEWGPHLIVPGEGWIVIVPRTGTGGDASGEDWYVLSVLEMMQHRGGGMEAEIDGEKIAIPEYNADQPDPSAPAAIRVWDPHPRRHIEADSPTRASLGLLDELQALNAAVKAIARSRLTGRGVLFVPQGVRFPTQPGQAGDGEDDLLDVFMQVAETAYRDPESAAATVPIVLEVPAEAIDKVEHLTFESDFDRIAIELREEIIKRFAMGLELPAEVLLGMSSASHWAVWSLTEEAIRLGVEPRLGIVADALTTEWMRPLLLDQAVPDADECLVWFDTAPLRVRANRAQTAIELFDRQVITAEALRRETGFADDDAPDALDGDPQPSDDTGDNTGDGQQEPQPPELPVDESQGPPDTLPSSAAPNAGTAAVTSYDGDTFRVPRDGGGAGDATSVGAGRGGGSHESLHAAADGLIHTVLCIAGEKIRRKGLCPRSRRAEIKTVSAAAAHTLIVADPNQIDEHRLLDTDAWDRIPELAGRYSADPACLEQSLRAYCRELIAAGEPHDYSFVAPLVRDCLVEAA